MKPLVLATHNSGKVAEFQAYFAPLGWEIISSASLGLTPPVEPSARDGATFSSNATLKAETACRASGQWALADDSGLCVAALDGAPGVDTANYGGFLRLLEVMKEIDDRTATFVCVLALARPGETTLLFTGAASGNITRTPHGQGGFGYDPVFVPRGQHGAPRTYAELSHEEKESISHRGRALAQLRVWMNTYSGETNTTSDT